MPFFQTINEWLTDGAMGNVASAVLMYALEAAWVFQRLLDQDYRQNHGGRLKPIADVKNEEVTEVFLPNGSSTPVLSRSPHHHSKPAKLTRHKKTNSEPFAMAKKQRRWVQQREPTEVTPPCACSTAADTMHWVSCHARKPGMTLRRAFSDINLPRHGYEVPGLKLVVSRGYATDPNEDFTIRPIV